LTADDSYAVANIELILFGKCFIGHSIVQRDQLVTFNIITIVPRTGFCLL